MKAAVITCGILMFIDEADSFGLGKIPCERRYFYPAVTCRERTRTTSTVAHYDTLPDHATACSPRHALRRRLVPAKKYVGRKLRHCRQSLVQGRSATTQPDEVMTSAAVAFPLLSRLFANASQLFQVGVLLGPLPTALAAAVTAYWAWHALVAGSRSYQSRVTADGIKTCRVPASKVGPGSPGFVDRAPLLDADAIRAEVESRYNPTLLVHGERGSGKTVAVRLALHAHTGIVHVKLWAQDLDSPLKALARAIIDVAGPEVPTGASMLVAEQALRRLKGTGWSSGSVKGAPIVVVELDKRCTSSQLQAVLLACKRWGDDENLAKFVVEAPSARIARGLTISLADLRVEGVKVLPLAPKEALQVARGSVPVAARREWGGARPDDLASFVVDHVGFGMLDLVRAGFAARSAQDPIAFRSAIESFAAREARAARGGVTAFLRALDPASERNSELEVALSEAVAGASAVIEGARGRNPGLDEVLDCLRVTEREFERAAGGVGPVCPLAVDPFSYKVVVRSMFFRDAIVAAAAAVANTSSDEGQIRGHVHAGATLMPSQT